LVLEKHPVRWLQVLCPVCRCPVYINPDEFTFLSVECPYCRTNINLDLSGPYIRVERG